MKLSNSLNEKIQKYTKIYTHEHNFEFGILFIDLANVFIFGSIHEINHQLFFNFFENTFGKLYLAALLTLTIISMIDSIFFGYTGYVRYALRNAEPDYRFTILQMYKKTKYDYQNHHVIQPIKLNQFSYLNQKEYDQIIKNEQNVQKSKNIEKKLAHQYYVMEHILEDCKIKSKA